MTSRRVLVSVSSGISWSYRARPWAQMPVQKRGSDPSGDQQTGIAAGQWSSPAEKPERTTRWGRHRAIRWESSMSLSCDSSAVDRRMVPLAFDCHLVLANDSPLEDTNQPRMPCRMRRPVARLPWYEASGGRRAWPDPGAALAKGATVLVGGLKQPGGVAGSSTQRPRSRLW